MRLDVTRLTAQARVFRLEIGVFDDKGLPLAFEILVHRASVSRPARPGHIDGQFERRSFRFVRRRSGLPLRRSINSCSPRVIGQSNPHARQHHVRRTDPAVIVVSGLTVPSAPHRLQRAGTRNRRGVVGTPGGCASSIPERRLLSRRRGKHGMRLRLSRCSDPSGIAADEPRRRYG